ARKRAFLLDSADGRGPRIGLLLKELGLVATLAAPYARDPAVQNLIGSPRLDSTHWRSISWRDSNAGYANGRFAMDINAIWVPRALESISTIASALTSIGFAQQQLDGFSPPGAAGRPIPVVNTDPATGLLLRDSADNTADAVAGVRRDVQAIVRAYPVGLFVDRLGPLVANDAYAPPSVWEVFRRDTYHSPRVVW